MPGGSGGAAGRQSPAGVVTEVMGLGRRPRPGLAPGRGHPDKRPGPAGVGGIAVLDELFGSAQQVGDVVQLLNYVRCDHF